MQHLSKTFSVHARVARCIGALLLALAVAAPLAAADLPVLKISALADGTLLMNGEPATLSKISPELAKLQQAEGVVWYYRENPSAEQPADVKALFAVIFQYQLPVSVSSKPDFSDYIDRNGNSQPRKR
jgi:hypothetical protein